MNKAERYIELVSDENGYLCDQHALKAVEIARAEMIERACDAYCKECDTKECEGTGECLWLDKFKNLMKYE